MGVDAAHAPLTATCVSALIGDDSELTGFRLEVRGAPANPCQATNPNPWNLKPET